MKFSSGKETEGEKMETQESLIRDNPIDFLLWRRELWKLLNFRNPDHQVMKKIVFIRYISYLFLENRFNANYSEIKAGIHRKV